MYIKRPIIRRNGKNYLLSRLIMEKYLGRKLNTDEIIHHIDKNPFNNNITNLLLTNRIEHKKIHKEIGMETRFKNLYKFNNKKLLNEYKKYKSSYIVSKIYGCHAITIERRLKNILGLKSIHNFRENLLNREVV